MNWVMMTMKLNGDINIQIKQLIASANGLPFRERCPVCAGGSSGERSLSVAQTDKGIWYQCFRNKCGIRGYVNGPVLLPKTEDLPKLDAAPVTIPLPIEHYQHLPVQELSIPPRWDEKRQMVMYPVLSYWGALLGYVQRRYEPLNEWWSGPKALNIIVNDCEPFLHFPYLTNDTFDGTLVIVEDLPSAEAIAPYMPCCALLGTNVTDAAVDLFVRIGVKKLIICLDNDAIAKAIKIKRHLELVFDTDVVFVNEDPKDMSVSDLALIFNKEDFV